MEKYKHIVACLDLSGIDRWIIRYAAFFADLMKSERLTFIHVIQSYDLPAKEQKSSQSDVRLKEYLHWKVNEHAEMYNLESANVEILVKKENRDAAQVIVDYVNESDAGLTILGKKADEDRKEMYSGRIMSMGQSDMLLVPLSPAHNLSSILLALDFTSSSEQAFDIGDRIARYSKASLSCRMLYALPKAYFPYTMRSSSSKEAQAHADEQMKTFFKKLADNPEKIACSKEVGEYHVQGNDLMEHANATGIQLVIVGAKGQTGETSTLKGLVAEQIRKYKSSVPVLIVKKSN